MVPSRWILLAAALAATVSCGGGSDAPADCASVREKLHRCGAITEGEIFCDEDGDFDRCVNGCVLRSSCGDLRRDRCTGVRTRDQQRCIDRCLDEFFLFRCSSGESVQRYAHCNGVADCDDGSDEVGCQIHHFTCDDGSEVEARFRCDRKENCPDGSDEFGCAETICPEGVTPFDPFA